MKQELFDLKGKNIAITGGAGVLGATLAKGFAKAGAKIIILDLAEERAIEVANNIGRNILVPVLMFWIDKVLKNL